jgi:hypothetical protein
MGLGVLLPGRCNMCYMLLLMSNQFNVYADFRRCNDHNLGHAWLHYIDPIQARVLNIFGLVDLYPRHMNLAQFQPAKDFFARDGDYGA